MRSGVRLLGPVLLAIAVLVGACSTSAEDPVARGTSTTAGATTTVPPTTTTVVPIPAPPPVALSSCGGGFRCGRLTVPIDYEDPTGGTMELAVVQRPAGDPSRRIGTLVLNPGGPGSSAVRRVRRGFTLTPEVAARFDIVGLDPRGIGESTPITCGAAVPAFRSLDLAPDDAAEQAALEAAAEAVAAECQASEGPRLQHLGTLDASRDVESLRMGLGEAQLSFVGISYGTHIGLLWAEAYPTSVRGMVLDGVVDPAESGVGTSNSQLDALDGTFTQLSIACAAEPTCPVLVDGGMEVAYDALLARLEAGAGAAEGIGPTHLTYAAFMASYGSEHWPDLWAAVHDGLAGDLDGIAAMADEFRSLVPYAAFALVTCLDNRHPLDLAEWRADARRAAKRSPRFGATLANELLPCAFLPWSGLHPHTVVAPGAPPILVVGSTGDVATPYAQAVDVAEELASGVLLTVELDGHVAIGASDCAEAAMQAYLVDGVLPAPGTRC